MLYASQKAKHFDRASLHQLNTDWVTFILDKNVLNILINSDAYQECQTYREQCHFLWQYLNSFHWSKNKVAKLLDVDHKCFEKQIFLPLETRPPGRPRVLDDNEVNLIITEIKKLIDTKENPTLYDIQQFIIEKQKYIFSL